MPRRRSQPTTQFAGRGATVIAALTMSFVGPEGRGPTLHISPRVIHYKIRVHGITLPADHPNIRRHAWRRVIADLEREVLSTARRRAEAKK